MKHAKIQQLGLERIWRLFELAEQEIRTHPERSKRYVELARRVGERTRARMPDELKVRFCKKCGAYLNDGKNTAMEGTLLRTVKCGDCGFGRKTGRKPVKRQKP